MFDDRTGASRNKFTQEEEKTCAFVRMNCVKYLNFIRYDRDPCICD